MKRSKTLLIALAGVMVMLAVYFALTLIPQDTADPTEEAQILLSPDSDTVSAITFDCGQGQLTLQRSNGFWSLSDDESFPVNQDIPKNMLSIVSPLTALRKVIDVPEDPALYGFDEDAVRVTVTDGKASHSFLIGDECSGREGYYVRLADSSAVYLAEFSLGVAYLHDSQYSLIQLDPFPDPDTDEITKLTLSLSRGELILKRVEENTFPNHDTLWAIQTETGLLPADAQAVNDLLEAIGALKPLSCKDHALSEEKSRELFKDSQGFQLEYNHVTKDDEGNETLTPQRYCLFWSLGEEEVLCRLDSSSQLCTLDTEAVNTVVSRAQEELRSADVFAFRESDMNTVKLTLSDGTSYLVLRKVTTQSTEDEPVTTVSFSLNGEEMNEESANAFTRALLTAVAEGFNVSLPEGSPAVTLEFVQTDGSSHTVALYRLGEGYAVSCNGLCFSSVSEETVSALLATLQ